MEGLGGGEQSQTSMCVGYLIKTKKTNRNTYDRLLLLCCISMGWPTVNGGVKRAKGKIGL